MTIRILPSLLSVALLTSFVTIVDVKPASAAKRKTLLEQLFPNAAYNSRQRRIQRERRLYGLSDNTDPEVIKKVKGPTYYTYKPEAFRKVKFAKIAAAISANEAARALAEAVIEPDILAGPEKPEVTNAVVDNQTELAVDAVKTNSIAAAEEKPQFSLDAISNISISAESEIAALIEKHYADDPAFLWLDENLQPNFRMRAMLYVLQHADGYGLDPANYELPNIDDLVAGGVSREEAAIRFEMSLSANAIRYMADAKDGSVNPNRISGYHDIADYKRDYASHFKTLITAEFPAREMLKSHPDNAEFASLKKELRNLMNARETVKLEPIATGTFIRPGQEHPELANVVAAIVVKGSAELKEKHKELLAVYDGLPAYEEAIVALVMDFQAEQNLKADGIIGRNTIFKLTGDVVSNRGERIKLAMERLRWLPDNLGSRHVFINQPAFRASFMVNGQPQLSMKVIVGKSANQTSFFSDTIETVEFNPYWNIPRSILVNEMLADVQANPEYFDQRGYEVLKHGSSKPVPGYLVDWYSQETISKYYVRQKPGSRNALGELKILFPNKHNIYMHDTPSRGLFARSNRALSHGCVRLEKPRDMAAAVMGTSVKEIGSLVNAGRNKQVAVPQKLPVYVAYFTAWPDSNGNIKYYHDMYGRDKALGKAIKATYKLRQQALSS